MKVKFLGACVSAIALLSGAAQAQISGGAVKIGVMNDQSGLYADLAGQGSVEAARTSGRSRSSRPLPDSVISPLTST